MKIRNYMVDVKHEKIYRIYLYLLLSIAFICSILLTSFLGQEKYDIPQYIVYLSTITMILLLVALGTFAVYSKIKRK